MTNILSFISIVFSFGVGIWVWDNHPRLSGINIGIAIINSVYFIGNLASG